MKIALYFKEEEPQSLEMLAEAMLAIKFKRYQRALEIIEEVKSIIEEQISNEVSEE